MAGGKKTAVYFENGIGNFIMLTPALAALENQGLSPVVYMDGADKCFGAVCDISLWPVEPTPESGPDPDYTFWPRRSDTGAIQSNPVWETGIHEAQTYLDFIDSKEKPKASVKSQKRLTLYLGKRERLIAFGNGSAHPGGFKKWPNEKWIELAGELIAQGCQIVFLGSAKEGVDTGAALVKAHERKVWNIAGEITLPETADVLKQVNCFVTTDSGLMHIADAVGCKTLCLWGPTLWTKNRPWSGNGVKVSADACEPCFGSPKYFECTDHICMNRIAVDAVVGEI